MTKEERRAAWREHDEWMKAVLADVDLTDGEKLVALRLALHKNIKSGRCDPGMDTLAKGAAMTERGARKAVRSLEGKGWITCVLGGHGPEQSNRYQLIRRNGGSPLDQPEVIVRGNGSAAKGEREDEQWSQNGGTAVPPNSVNSENTEKNAGTVCEDTHATDFEIVEGKESRAPTDAEIDAAFEDFWRQCPRQVDQGAARSKYLKVIKSGKATAPQLFYAMMLYSAAREEADQKHYDKSPAKWLADECWNDDPAAHALGSARLTFAGLAQKLARDGAVRARMKMADGADGFSAACTNDHERRAQPPAAPAAEDERWTRVKATLLRVVSEMEFTRFFAETAFLGLNDGVVTLRTKAPVDARKIKEKYEPRLVELWKIEAREVRGITVLDAYGTIAEPQLNAVRTRAAARIA
jgi:hypothetical protein